MEKENDAFGRGGVEDIKLETKANDTKKFRDQGQAQPFRGQSLSRPKTGMLEAKDQRHNAEVIYKKKTFAPKILKFSGRFRCSPKKKVFAPNILKFSGKFKRSPGKIYLQNFFRKLSGVLQDETKLVMTLAPFPINQKLVLSSSRELGIFEDLQASRPRPRT